MVEGLSIGRIELVTGDRPSDLIISFDVYGLVKAYISSFCSSIQVS